MKARRIFHVVLAILVAAACAEPPEVAVSPEHPTIGRPAPELGPLEQLAGRPTATRLAELRERWVVVDFWTTWCAGCRQSTPHVDELARHFLDRPVSFLAVSNENPDLIRRVLARWGVEGVPVLRDECGETFRRYRIAGIPTALVIAPGGDLLHVTHPGEITTEAIEALLNGGSVDLPPQEIAAAGEELFPWGSCGQTAAEPPPAPKAEIRIVEEGGYTSKASPATGEILIPGAPLEVLFNYAGFPSWKYQVDLPEAERQTLFFVHIVPADGRLETAQELLQRRLEEEHGLVAETVTRQVEAWILTAEPGSGPPAADSAKNNLTQARSGSSGYLIGAASAGELAKSIAGLFEVPVFDETGLGDSLFEFDLFYDDLESLRRELASHGLRMDPEERRVERVVISKRPS